MSKCYKCDNEATSIIELNVPTGWRCTHACSDHNSGRYIHNVHDTVVMNQCGYERCYVDIPGTRDYCSSHKYEHQRGG